MTTSFSIKNNSEEYANMQVAKSEWKQRQSKLLRKARIRINRAQKHYKPNLDNKLRKQNATIAAGDNI